MVHVARWYGVLLMLFIMAGVFLWDDKLQVGRSSSLIRLRSSPSRSIELNTTKTNSDDDGLPRAIDDSSVVTRSIKLNTTKTNNDGLSAIGVATRIKLNRTKTQNDDGLPRVVLVTYLFTPSDRNSTPRYVRLFLETATASGVDVVKVVGNHNPFASTPFQRKNTNIEYIPMSWGDLCDRVAERLRILVDALRTASHYKIIDFKPLFGYLFPELFPELITSYDYWGHMDNDMLLGKVRDFLPKNLMDYDVITIIGSHSTWGPFTLYKNVPHMKVKTQI